MCVGWAHETHWPGTLWMLEELQLDGLARARLGKVLIARGGGVQARHWLLQLCRVKDWDVES